MRVRAILPAVHPGTGGGAVRDVDSTGVAGRVVGFYRGRRIRIGDVFDIESEKQFSARWMERVTEPAPAAPPGDDPLAVLSAPTADEAAATAKERARDEHAKARRGATPPQTPTS